MLESGIDPGTSWLEVGRKSQYCKYTVNALHFSATPPGIIELPNKYTVNVLHFAGLRVWATGLGYGATGAAGGFLINFPITNYAPKLP